MRTMTVTPPFMTYDHEGGRGWKSRTGREEVNHSKHNETESIGIG